MVEDTDELRKGSNGRIKGRKGILMKVKKFFRTTLSVIWLVLLLLVFGLFAFMDDPFFLFRGGDGL